MQRDLMTLAASVEEAIHKAIKSLQTRQRGARPSGDRGGPAD